MASGARKYCTDIQLTSTGPSVQVTNGANIESSTCAAIPLSNKLSQEAQVRHIFDNLKSGSLISIGKLCDDDSVAIITNYHVNIVKYGKIIIGGQRNPSNGI